LLPPFGLALLIPTVLLIRCLMSSQKKKPHHISMAGLEELKVSPVLNDTT